MPQCGWLDLLSFRSAPGTGPCEQPANRCGHHGIPRGNRRDPRRAAQSVRLRGPARFSQNPQHGRRAEAACRSHRFATGLAWRVTRRLLPFLRCAQGGGRGRGRVSRGRERRRCAGGGGRGGGRGEEDGQERAPQPRDRAGAGSAPPRCLRNPPIPPPLRWQNFLPL